MTRPDAASVLVCLALGGCADVLPGEPVGAFVVEGALAEDGCGDGVPALDAADYDVELRVDDTLAWWQAEGRPRLVGRHLGDGRFRFAFRSTFPVADPATPGGGDCRLAQEEVVEARTPPGDDAVDADLVGAQDVTYRPVGGRCEFLLDQGFDALPCTLRWELLGWRLDP